MRSREPVRAYAAMNTVRALECLAFADLSAPELAARLQVNVRTARRLLQRLALEGFVAQEGGHRRRYRATLRLAALGRQLLDHAPLSQAALPRVARLAQDTACVAQLWIPGYQDQLVCALGTDGQTDPPDRLGPLPRCRAILTRSRNRAASSRRTPAVILLRGLDSGADRGRGRL